MGAVEARLFAEEGARVCVTDVLEEQGRQVAADITGSGGEAFFSRLDITSEEDWARAVDEVVSRFGKLDILINNAAINHVGAVEETTAEDWDRVMAVTAKGAFLGTKAAIPAMRRAGGGSIINISSGAGWWEPGDRPPTTPPGRRPHTDQIDRHTVRPRRHQGQRGASRRRRHQHAGRKQLPPG